MRLMRINTRTIHYSLYEGLGDPIVDDDGFETGEREILFSSPVPLVCNVSVAGGEAWAEVFGTLENYERVIITDDMTCPIDENSRLWIDTSPEGNAPYDYVVWRVAKYINHIAYAVRKVTVSG